MIDYRQFETQYKTFYSEHTDLSTFENIDFFGVNFSEEEIIFKLYYTSTKVCPELFEPLNQKKMIGNLNVVKDTMNSNKLRYDIGLINRTNGNMQFLYQWIDVLYPEIKQYREEIEKFYELKCSTDEQYKLAAMYFLGVITETENCSVVEAIKFHYILRMCSNTNKIGENYDIDNQKVLSTICKIGILEIEKIGYFLEKCLKNTKAELWIAAVDYYKHKSNKYKIYLKNFDDNIYDSLYNQLLSIGQEIVAFNVRFFKQWLHNHKEFSVYGLAICYSENNGWSLNFYLNKQPG